MTPRERPILFSTPMVRAILAGAKSQTRRIVKPKPEGVDVAARKTVPFNGRPGLIAETVPCPYGVPGDRLWVRETFALSIVDPETTEPDTKNPHDWDPPIYRADGDEQGGGWTDGDGKKIAAPWRSPIHMPRWASRLTLELTEVRVERLQDIGKDGRVARDVLAEGIDPAAIEAQRKWFHPDDAPALAYKALWESINGPGSWDANPWVWCLSFTKRETP